MSVGQATSRVVKPAPATLSSKDQLVRPLAAPAPQEAIAEGQVPMSTSKRNTLPSLVGRLIEGLPPVAGKVTWNQSRAPAIGILPLRVTAAPVVTEPRLVAAAHEPPNTSSAHSQPVLGTPSTS